ncbi:MAG: ethanolamine ammonia-lyase subunit EutC [Gemmataceae bacterium]
MNVMKRIKMTQQQPLSSNAEVQSLIEVIRARTPARILVGRAGPGYPTTTQLDLRRDHAAAVDAVQAELDLDQSFQRDFVERWRLFLVKTRAVDKQQYLMRPDLGRRLDDDAKKMVAERCPSAVDFQVIIGDGLSVAAIKIQVPSLLPLLRDAALGKGWSFGQPFCIRYCRVGILNEVGELLKPVVAVLLIGERPGLGTAESMSAYMAYRPQRGHTDAQRNLISNIHGGGVPCEEAAKRIVALAEQMRQKETSGVAVKEELTKLEARHKALPY